jgi:hypothetical protein
MLGFRCWLEFNGICKNTHAWIFEKIYNLKKNKKIKNKDILKILIGFNEKF